MIKGIFAAIFLLALAAIALAATATAGLIITNLDWPLALVAAILLIGGIAGES